MKLLELKKSTGDLGPIHFIGIGGIGISGIAEIMHTLGYKVQGSDLTHNSNTRRIQNLGIKVFIGHDASNINDAEYVVISSAVKDDNVEIKEAQKLKIPIISRAEMLAELVKLKTSIAISGTHGKTTTTTMIAQIFESQGLNPTVINGGIINNKLTNAYLGSGDFLIVEADESDATFIKIHPTISVITNIDPEHLDFYKSYENLYNSFKKFITNLPFYGFAVCCIDHHAVSQLALETTERSIITYGIQNLDADVRAFNIREFFGKTLFDVSYKKLIIQDLELSSMGIHNVLNSLAAIAIALKLDFDLDKLRKGLHNFSGVKRRFTTICEKDSVLFIDDYAHHPAEISSTLKTAKTLAKLRSGRVIAVFQPHRYSRLKHLMQEFSKSFEDANEVYLTEVYAAGEEEIKDVNSEALARLIPKANLITDLKQVQFEENDVVIFMGAGSISKIAYKYLGVDNI